MSSIPLVSILIPVFNRESLVGETIESAINQSYPNIEIIIIDNCSTDNTFQVLKKYAEKDKRIKLFRNDLNIGPVLNWKRCLDESIGYYIKILFSDDIISKDFVEICVNAFDDDCAFVIGKFSIFNSNINEILSQSNYETQVKLSRRNYLKSITHYNFEYPVTATAGLFRSSDLKKSLLLNVPNELLLDHSINGAGTDLLLYLNPLIEYNYINICNTTAYCRYHEDSISIKDSDKLSPYYLTAKIYFANLLLKKDKNDYFANLLKARFFITELKSVILLKKRISYFKLVNTRVSLYYVFLNLWNHIKNK